MIPAEQWQKEAGTWMIHCQGSDEEHPVLTVDLIKRIQRDAWEQGIREAQDDLRVELDILLHDFGVSLLKRGLIQ